MTIRFPSLAVGLICTVVLGVATLADAQTITNPVNLDSATVLPTGVITPLDNIQLDVSLVSGSSDIFLTQPITIGLTGNDFVVDIFAESGTFAALDQESVLVPLGTLSPGTYTYEVNLSTVLIDPVPIAGSFTVVPEPSTLSLAAFLSVGCGLSVHRR